MENRKKNKLERLNERLQAAEKRRKDIDERIRTLKQEIIVEENSELKAVMTKYDVDLNDLTQLLSEHKNRGV